MTTKERAAFRRLEKRRESLYTALCIIKTWLGIPDENGDTLYHIGRLCTEQIEAEQAAQRKEGN